MVSDDTLRQVLRDARVIALVGASPDQARASYSVGEYLKGQGYRVIPVNPRAVGEVLFGEPVVSSLVEAAEADFLDIFRRSEAVPGIVAEALEHLPALRCVWMQLGVEHAKAAALAEARGITVVQNRCPKIEIPRLGLSQ